jgi:hypothetical protein
MNKDNKNENVDNTDKKLHISDVISSKTDTIKFLKETFYQGWLQSQEDFNSEIEYGNLDKAKERIDKMFDEWFDKFYYL